MPKPRYPFQPFVEVNITDDTDHFFDRIFIPEDLIIEGKIPSDFFIKNLQSITARLGYPFTVDVLDNLFGFIESVDSDNVRTIDTKSKMIGLVTIDCALIGMENLYESDLEENEDSSAGISVASHIVEISKYNKYRYERQFLTSRIAIMALPVEEKTEGSKHEWLYYHINNFMNRGYKIIIENQTTNGVRLERYILDANYTNCTLITENANNQYQEPLNHQPIEAFYWNAQEKPSIDLAMRRLATHLIDPSSDLIKQKTALVALNN